MTEHGECGSTKAVRQLLAAGGVEIDQLSDCQGQVDALTERLTNARTEALANLSAELKRRRAAHEAASQALITENAQRRTALDVQRTALRTAQDALTTQPLHKRLLGTLQLTPKTLQTSLSALQLSRRERRGYQRLAAQAQEIAQLDAAADERVQRHTQTLQEALNTLAAGMESEHFRGAIGEEQVAAALRKLGDDYHVFHDLQPALDHPITLFDRTYRRVQLDHVVLGPFGIAVLETKNWSAAFCRRDNLSDPYEQTACGAHLLRCLLREEDLETKVYAVLVRCNSLPPRPPDVWGAVLWPSGLVKYLEGRKHALSARDIQRCAEVLSHSLQ